MKRMKEFLKWVMRGMTKEVIGEVLVFVIAVLVAVVLEKYVFMSGISLSVIIVWFAGVNYTLHFWKQGRRVSVMSKTNK